MAESVWDYPRPPALVTCEDRVRVVHGGVVVAESEAALRVLETSHPPTIYLPPADVRSDLLEEAGGQRTFCEWKGWASYLDVVAGGRRAERAAWTYRDPVAAYAALRDHIAVYPGRVDECWLGGERVRAQGGDFYGGWITSAVEGPFKGAAGTRGW